MKKVKSWTSFVPIIAMILAYVFLRLTAGETTSPYNIHVLLFFIPFSYACEGYIQGKRRHKFFRALILNFSLILLMSFIPWLWVALTRAHDEWYQMYITLGWFQIIAIYCGLYLLFLMVIYSIFYGIGKLISKARTSIS
ncbi:hypothetical protein [Pseudolactococcus yaeyamensis]